MWLDISGEMFSETLPKLLYSITTMPFLKTVKKFKFILQFASSQNKKQTNKKEILNDFSPWIKDKLPKTL